jgi:hypothetical protein
MRIGLIVDGQSEFRSLDFVLRRIEIPNVLVGLLYSNIHPHAPTPQIVRAMAGNVRIFAHRQADMVITLIDREDRPTCPGQWASEIAQTLNRSYASHGMRFGVVVKDTCYENWLISDTAVFRAMPKRFNMSGADIRKIAPNKADSVDAQAILKGAAINDAYSKVEDAVRIMALADPLRMAANSRSFRKLLRELQHPKYKDQSLLPAR